MQDPHPVVFRHVVQVDQTVLATDRQQLAGCSKHVHCRQSIGPCSA